MADATKFDRKLARILEAAAQVFAEEGFDRASIRGVAKKAGISVPGLYYYVQSKEQLLFLLQYHAFDALIDRYAGERAASEDPEASLERIVRNHLERFLGNVAELAVCSHELGRLEGRYRARIRARQREYFRLVVELLADLARRHAATPVDPRTAALALFGSINWVYTWYRPGVDPPAARLASDLVRLFLHGLLGAPPGRPARRRAKNVRAVRRDLPRPS